MHETERRFPDPVGIESTVQVLPPSVVPIPSDAVPLELPWDRPMIWHVLVVAQSIELTTWA
jgi:hypothetical protein